MRYGVIVCPKCKIAKGINLDSKTTKCVKCNKTLQIHKLRILFESSDLCSIGEYIGLVNAKNDGNYEDFKIFLKNNKI